MKKLLRTTTVLLVVILLILAVLLVILLNFHWNLARPWLNARTSEALGRPFVIAGDLSLSWEKASSSNQGWQINIPWPHLLAQDIHISNSPALTGNAITEMASIKQLDFSLNTYALLKHEIEIPLLRFDSPVINLQRNKDGTNNWIFKNNQTSRLQLKLKRIVFAKGSLHLVDALRHADITANINTLDADTIYGVTWQLHGKLNNEDVSGTGRAGAVLSLQQQTTPYPIMAQLNVGKTRMAVEGTLTKPADLAALNMHLKVSGPSLSKFYAISGIYMPETPPFAIEGQLIGALSLHDSHWIFEHFSGKVGASDIEGRLDYQSKLPRPLLTGAIVSHVLHVTDLAPLIGADSNTSKIRRGNATLQPANKLLPIDQFKAERWRSVDADIKFSANTIILNKTLPINKLITRVRLHDGVLSLLPLDFVIAGGSMRSNITLDGSGESGKNIIKTSINVTARHLHLKQLFPTFKLLQASIGEINGDASLSSVGNSVSSLLGSANGELKLLINQGTVSKLLLEEIGLNIGSVILTTLSGDKQVKLNCMATELSINNGMMRTRSFIIDTDNAILNITGNINLAQEQLNLTINTHSRGMRVFSLRAPIYIHGSFKQPHVSVDKGVMVMKAGSAIALVILAPVAALLPLIKTGPGEKNDCASLLAIARIKPVSPPPGKTYPIKSPHN